MQWPKKIVAAFLKVPMVVMKGLTREEVVQYLLDETARRAVGRAKGNQKDLPAAYTQAYTPLGGVSTEVGMAPETRKLESITFDKRWCKAVDALYEYVRQEPQTICDAFRNEQKPWPWDI